jgi:STAS-like domain of unknown function (DUF4325)
MANKMISIAAQFSRYPGPRYRKDGPFSGEEFREEFLAPALQNAGKTGSLVIVTLDGVAGYGSSFLEEAFGGLVRTGFSPQFLKQHLRIEAKAPRFQHHKIRAESYIEEEASRKCPASAPVRQILAVEERRISGSS